ncbi:YhcN/YlaJ family sporulation lipoprotein [Paenibacillus sp. B1-33]|uniref:YhcN/YlaJ family sporulation lipoprotein n=1 Tax=unclassified Paenibacillus TaxID=185978 RepID=UPI003D2B7C86
MQAKAVLLTLTAALVMTMGITGCGNRNMSTKSVRQHNYDGINPLGTDHRYNANRYNTNFQGDGLRSYSNDFGPDGYRSNNYNYGNGTYRNYGYNRMDGFNRMDGYNRMDGGRYGAHSVNKMEMSQKIANKLTSVKGVKSAHVMLTNNNNAYVAVVTDHTTSGMKSKSHPAGRGPRPYSAGNLGAYDGTPAGNDNVSTSVKEHIANVVKKEAPNCNNVYVSANPDFVNRMNDYSKQAAAGHPIAGFTNEFQELVYRLFPTNAASQSYNQPTRIHNMAPGTR